MTDKILFNLIFNAMLSFFAGLAIVWTTIKIFRIGNSRWKLFFLLLPFLKILWDLSMGIPRESVLNAGVDPFDFPVGSRVLGVSVGVSEWGPVLNLVLTAFDWTGRAYTMSVADFLSAGVERLLGEWTLEILLSVVIGISVFLFSRRLIQFMKFEILRRRDRESARATPLETIDLGIRTVDVYTSGGFSGTPFTGGFLRPFICIPDATYRALAPDEFRAVVQHELAHVRAFDLPVSLLIQILGDLLWFIPGYRALSQKIDDLRELVADKNAVRSGAEGGSLATALLKLKEFSSSQHYNHAISTFLKRRSVLKNRVLTLAGQSEDPLPRFGWRFWIVRYPVAVWTTFGVLFAKFGGNHETLFRSPTSWLLELLSRGWT
jgi:beta-lactamase regulating signal transducer with metallopeptidase domain